MLLVSLTSVPSEIMEKVILGSAEKHLEDNTVVGHSSMRGNPACPTFYNRVSHLGDQGKPGDLFFKFFFSFSKAFD